MIAHVAEAGEGRGRVLLHVSAQTASPIALEAALLVARAFNSELESLFVEDETLFDIASFPFAREISLSGRESRALTPEMIECQCRSAATAIAKRIRLLAASAEVPLNVSVVRSEPISALASACAARGPWNVIALAEPMRTLDCEHLGRILASVPDTTGLIVVGPKARRSSGRIVGVVEDIGELDGVLKTARRLLAVSGEVRATLLLVADSDDEAQTMDDQVRLAIGPDDEVEVLRARIEPNEPAVAAELIRRLAAGFLVGRIGGYIFPASGPLRHLSAVLECPLLLIR